MCRLMEFEPLNHRIPASALDLLDLVYRMGSSVSPVLLVFVRVKVPCFMGWYTAMIINDIPYMQQYSCECNVLCLYLAMFDVCIDSPMLSAYLHFYLSVCLFSLQTHVCMHFEMHTHTHNLHI